MPRGKTWQKEWEIYHKTDLPAPTCLCGSQMYLEGHNELEMGRWYREYRCVSHSSHWCQQEPRKRQIRWFNDPPKETTTEHGRLAMTIHTPYEVEIKIGEWYATG